MTQFIARQQSSSGATRGIVGHRWIAERSFVRNVAILGGGTALAQVFNILLAPVLTRLYVPDHFGQYALFVSFLNVAMVAVSLRYELGIVAARTEHKAAHLTFSAFLFSLPMSLIAAGGLFLFIRFSWLGFSALPWYTPLLMATALVLVGAFSALRYWFVRQEQFACISQALVVQNGARSISQAAAGAVGGQLAGLLGGELIGRSAGMTRMFRAAWPQIKAHVFPVERGSFSEVLRENWQYPIYSLPSSLIDSAAANICVPLMVWYYGSNAGGYFALVQRVLAIPLVLISASVADAFQARLALYVRDRTDRTVQLFHRTGAGLLCIGVIPTVLLMRYGEPLFHMFFGGKWATAGRLAAVVAPWFLAQSIVSPLSRLVFVLEGQRLKLIYDALALTGMISVFAFSHWQQISLVHAVMLLSAVGTLTFVVYYFVLLRIVSRRRCAVNADHPQPCLSA
jgi:lipopolysaccharide exporter